MSEREFSELAAGHALHALSDADEQRFAEARAEHPQWQHLIDADHDIAAELGAALTPVEPPAAVRAALLMQIAGPPREEVTGAPVDVAATRPAEGQITRPADATAARGPRWSRMLFTLAACLVLIVGAGIGTTVIVSQLQMQRPESVVALEQIQSATDAESVTIDLASGGTATAHWSGDLGKAVLVAAGLDAPAAGKTYELWFVRGDVPIAAGLFSTDDGKATALLDEPMQPGDAIAVTVEQSGGSPTGAPTTDPIIVIPTA